MPRHPTAGTNEQGTASASNIPRGPKNHGESCFDTMGPIRAQPITARQFRRRRTDDAERGHERGGVLVFLPRHPLRRMNRQPLDAGEAHMPDRSRASVLDVLARMPRPKGGAR